MKLSKKMKAVVFEKYGSPEVLQIQNIEKPIPKDKELLIKIFAATINSGDVRVRGLVAKGFMKVIMRVVLGFSKPRKPILGTVYSGVIESVGSKVYGFKAGDKVFGVTGFNFGTYAEYITVKENSKICYMPDNATFEEAVSIIFGGQTAIYFLEKSKIFEKSKPSILIIGATGSVGVAAVQIARYYGAIVTIVCSSKGKSLADSLGASKIILYDKEDFTQQNEKYDMVFDAVGNTTKKKIKHLLKLGGVYKTVGGFEYAKESQQQLEFLKELFEKRKLKPVIDKVFPFEEVVDAHKYVDTGRKKGNVVLKVFE